MKIVKLLKCHLNFVKNNVILSEQIAKQDIENEKKKLPNKEPGKFNTQFVLFVINLWAANNDYLVFLSQYNRCLKSSRGVLIAYIYHKF